MNSAFSTIIILIFSIYTFSSFWILSLFLIWISFIRFNSRRWKEKD